MIGVRAREFAIVRTQCDRVIVRLRFPQFWVARYSHVLAETAATDAQAMTRAVSLTFFDKTGIGDLSSRQRAQLRQIGQIRHETQYTCRVTITHLLRRPELVPHQTRHVHAEWVRGDHVLVHLDRAPDGPQWPEHVQSHYFVREQVA